MPVIGWILLGVLALIIIILLMPVVVGLSYRDETFTVTLRLLGLIKLTLLPQDEEKKAKKEAKRQAKEAKKKRKKSKRETEGEEKPKRKRTVKQWLYLIKRILYSADAAKDLALKGIRVYDFEFILAVHAEEAGDTAIRFGQIQAAVGGARALLENLIKIRYKTLVLIPDFAGQYDSAPIFSCKIAACPVIMLVVGIAALRAFLRYRRVFGREPLSKEQQKELEERREKRRAEKRAEAEKQAEAARQAEADKTA